MPASSRLNTYNDKSTLVLANYAASTDVGAATDDAKMYYTSTGTNGATSNSLTIDVKNTTGTRNTITVSNDTTTIDHGLTASGTCTFSGLTYPTTNGTDGHVLTSDGNGNVAWEAVSSSGGSVTSLSDTTITSAADNEILVYNSTTSKWENSSSFTGNVTGNLTGDVTGNVTGNCTGSSGSCTGNAATASALAASIDIAGVSFDGSTNINIPINNLSDTNISSAANNNILTYDNASSKWINSNSFTGSVTGNVTGNVTGDVTGDLTGNADTATTAGTVTDASQPNITSVGTLTSLAVSGSITADGGVSLKDDNSTKITNLAAPTAGNDATNKTYVDTQDTSLETVINTEITTRTNNVSSLETLIAGSAQGLTVKDAVQYATTVEASTVGGTFTANTNFKDSTWAFSESTTNGIDGNAFQDGNWTDGDRILIKDQTTNQYENGIFVLTKSGTAGNDLVFTFSRPADADGDPVSNSEIKPGMYVWCEEGTTNSNKAFTSTSATSQSTTAYDNPVVVFTLFSQVVINTGSIDSTHLQTVGGSYNGIDGDKLNLNTNHLQFDAATKKLEWADDVVHDGSSVHTNGDLTIDSGGANGATSNFYVQASTGNLMIPTGNLTVTQGTVTAQNVIATSDFNLKKNINELDNSLDVIKSLRGVRYEWKDQENVPAEIGMIAQEVEQVVPELVKKTNMGFKGIEYQKLTAILIEAVKDLSSRIDNVNHKLDVSSSDSEPEAEMMM